MIRLIFEQSSRLDTQGSSVSNACYFTNVFVFSLFRVSNWCCNSTALELCLVSWRIYRFKKFVKLKSVIRLLLWSHGNLLEKWRDSRDMGKIIYFSCAILLFYKTSCKIFHKFPVWSGFPEKLLPKIFFARWNVDLKAEISGKPQKYVKGFPCQIFILTNQSAFELLPQQNAEKDEGCIDGKDKLREIIVSFAIFHVSGGFFAELKTNAFFVEAFKFFGKIFVVYAKIF